MKNIIIGTAGHIDHGKTTLIKALTGHNTDRWKEEQIRGITIDLGFTYFDMKNGDRAGIIDVPGHEKFIHNMAAGVVGMDLVLLVVAADEGIMPQTREHVDILGLLGIEKSIIVLNKCDLVEEEWADLVEEELKEELRGTFLENAPVVRVSAVTGQGLNALKDTIESMTRAEVKEKNTQTIPRLPVDRVFTLPGFGTIVTGTLISGTITREDVLELYPNEKECKIRSIQVHGKDQQQCSAGQRAAINLSNIKKSEISRGCVLAPKNSMRNTDLLDVKISVLPGSSRTVTNRERLHLYIGTSEILCRAVLLDCEKIEPGESGLAQLRLEEKTAVKRGDRFVIRFYSPLETIGGGIVLEPNPKRKKRFDEQTIYELQKKESGSLADVMELHIKEHGDTMITLAELAKLTAYAQEEMQALLKDMEAEETVYVFPMKKDTYIWHRESEFIVRQKMIRDLKEYHKKYPYRFGRKKAEIQMTYMKKVKANVFDFYIERMTEQRILGKKGEYLHLTDFEVKKDEIYLEIEKQFTDTFKRAAYEFIRITEVPAGNISEQVREDVLQMLVEEGTLMRLTEDTYTLTVLMEAAAEQIQNYVRKEHVITFSQVRDLFSTSRKNAKLILEETDRRKITKKAGAETERVPY
ncbi:SelB translation factor [uncultured Roseburia sp.]|uniref:Selenocysteine-specific elongation factor n=1 Tax=Brotonthovivens ammoniilytica TaxID=2981725 RepID=A0ABT2TJJ7_9FIRM|nr:selenocysteine-specific translation elongation factor [Brotonthovivens ammoniilytica]MCU6761699.1 selenocysteine-specific translation elongation factor [Brotonthovivens ammoniilytica]SCI43880.1 SelB translation factor [uncultured Roseburia sp.]